MFRIIRGCASAALLALMLAVTVTSTAAAATAPTATTTAATGVSATTATLNGSVDPAKAATTYYFQYGTSTAYGSKSATGTANGNSAKAVSEPVSGLKPGTTYHFRLVASNASGTVNGADETFTTAVVGGGGKNTISIGAKPRTVTWGRTTVIAGQLSGPKSNNQTVTLESTAYPYTKPYTSTGLSTTSSSTGTYSFTIRPAQNTRYEVVAATKTPVTSPPVTVGVKVRVALHLSTLNPVRGQLVRFYGTVTPAHNGRYAAIQRRTSTGAWRTVASARLVAGGSVAGTAVSKFSRRLRIYRSGTYRVQVNPRDGNHLTGRSTTRTEHVH